MSSAELGRRWLIRPGSSVGGEDGGSERGYREKLVGSDRGVHRQKYAAKSYRR